MKLFASVRLSSSVLHNVDHARRYWNPEPVYTRRNDNVIITPKRRHFDVVITLRYVPFTETEKVAKLIGFIVVNGVWLKLSVWQPNYLNTLRPRQNGRHFADDIFKHILVNENVWIPIKISLKFVPKGSINNIPALV